MDVLGGKKIRCHDNKVCEFGQVLVNGEWQAQCQNIIDDCSAQGETCKNAKCESSIIGLGCNPNVNQHQVYECIGNKRYSCTGYSPQSGSQLVLEEDCEDKGQTCTHGFCVDPAASESLELDAVVPVTPVSASPSGVSGSSNSNPFGSGSAQGGSTSPSSPAGNPVPSFRGSWRCEKVACPASGTTCDRGTVSSWGMGMTPVCSSQNDICSENYPEQDKCYQCTCQ
jgi:hypothetical protein